MLFICLKVPHFTICAVVISKNPDVNIKEVDLVLLDYQ